MAKFVFKIIFLSSMRKLGTTTGTKFAPTYACIFMDEVETEFLKSQELQPFLWLR